MTPGRPSLRTALLLFAALIAVGTIGYMLNEGWSPEFALYTAVTTLATLGTERPTTPAGEAFTTVYVLVGVGTAFYLLGAVVVFVWFPKRDDERRLLARYQAEDNPATAGARDTARAPAA